MSTNNTNTIAAAHDALMNQQVDTNHRGNQGNIAGFVGPAIGNGYPALNPMQATNPNFVPTQTIQEKQIVQKAIKMLTNHQLLMKFATENQQSIPAARLYWEKVVSANL